MANYMLKVPMFCLILIYTFFQGSVVHYCVLNAAILCFAVKKIVFIMCFLPFKPQTKLE